MFLSATWLYCIDVSVSVYRSSHNSVWLCFCHRFLTFCYLAAFNCWLLLCPATLSHDWQMGSVPLLTSLSDSRNIATCLFFGCCFLVAYRGIADFEVSLMRLPLYKFLSLNPINSFVLLLVSLRLELFFLTARSDVCPSLLCDGLMPIHKRSKCNFFP
jgi:hypothetical protein